MPAPLDLAFIRAQFPAFAHPETGQWVMSENAGGSYAAKPVIDQLHHFMTATKVQPYWPFAPSAEGGRAMDRSKDLWTRALNAEPEEVMFGPSTSMNTYVLAQALRAELAVGDEVIVTNQDHEANVGAWRRLADGNSGIVVRELSVDRETGRLDMGKLKSLLNSRTKLVFLTHCSNVVGEIHDIAAIAKEVHAAGARLGVDGVSCAPHLLPDVKALGADFYYFSLYKVYGPHQGLLYVKREHLERIKNQGHFFNEPLLGKRLTPAGPQHGEIASSGGIIDYLEAVYAHHLPKGEAPAATLSARVQAVCERFHAQECLQANRILTLLREKGARVLGPQTAEPHRRAATIAFRPRRGKPADVVDKLVAAKIACGSGHFYAYRVIEALGIPLDEGVVRLSLVHYNDESDVTRILEALDRAL
jgi:cysteine desulfurase family protein (TIGR01976 family)